MNRRDRKFTTMKLTPNQVAILDAHLQVHPTPAQDLIEIPVNGRTVAFNVAAGRFKPETIYLNHTESQLIEPMECGDIFQWGSVIYRLCMKSVLHEGSASYEMTMTFDYTNKQPPPK